MEDLRPLCYGIITPLFIIATMSILMRIWVRGFTMRSFGYDDWSMATQLIFFSCEQALLYYFIGYGGGLHITEVEAQHPNWLIRLIKGLLVEEYWYVWEQFSIKICFLLFYFRLSSTTWFLYALWAIIAWHVSTTIAIWLLYSFQCMPLAAFWDPATYPNVKCLSTKITYFIPYSLNLFTDVLILILPIPTIATLRMSRQKRIAVLVVLTTGGAAVLTGGLRAIILFEFAESPDFTWALGKMIIISSAELSVGIIAANMPALKAFWTCWRQNKLGAGQGVGISQSEGKSGKGSSGNPHGVELSHGVNSTRSWSELGRPIRLPSTESEEALWEDQRAKGKNKIHIIASQATQSDKL